MLKYDIRTTYPDRYILEISLSFVATGNSHIIQSSFWRPGRYEAGNFPRKIIGLRAFNPGGRLKTEKINSHQWKLHCRKGDEVKVKYRYYADELTAGNTYFDSELFLMNPVNALVYILGFEEEFGDLSLHHSPNWSVSTALSIMETQAGRSVFSFQNIQELMDSPILAGNNMQTMEYEVKGVPFFIHIAGENVPNAMELQRDFEAFTAAQINAFGSFPVKEYHFLMVLVNHRAYHGVEHEKSTAMLFGPAAKLSERNFMREILGLSSHELYHTWNVKSLRPKDWTPYDFKGPMFSRLGYIAEGVTTFKGDHMLWRSGVFSDKEFLAEIEKLIERHEENYGRKEMGLAEASIDMWVDGYGRTTPGRRVSIYNEGAILSIIIDLWLLQHTELKYSLDSFMRILYQNFGAKRGFFEDDFWSLLKSLADAPWDELKATVVDKEGELMQYLFPALNAAGIKVEKRDSDKVWEREWGMSVREQGDDWVVNFVAKNSNAENAGIWFDQDILEVNGKPAEEFFSVSDSEIPDESQIKLKSGFRTRTVSVKKGSPQKAFTYHLMIEDSGNSIFKAWKNGTVLSRIQA